MNSISVMELNTKSPFLWDMDNLMVFPSRAADVSKKLQLVDSEFEQIEGFEIGTFHSLAGKSDAGSGSPSDLGYGSSSKSTKSASVDSSSYREIRQSSFTLGGSDLDFSQDQSYGKGSVCAWPTTDISIGSGDSLIGLKLGKRTYFEDVSGSNTGKASAVVPESAYPTGKRSKLSCHSTETLCCQVEGCNLDLSSAKGYHRKHRVCETHAKSPKVVICGVERRFCQQCSRFHGMSEFDQKKRSCRRRLSDHNARRRKPKPEVIQFSSMRLPSSLHVDAEGRNQISLTFNQVPMVQTRPNSNATWDFTSSSKITQEEKLALFSSTKPRETGFKLTRYDSTLLLSPNGSTAEVFHQGYHQVQTTTNNMNTAPELRALSLLSTNSWSCCSQEPTPTPTPTPNQPLDHSSSLLNQHNTRSHDYVVPVLSGEYWPGDQQQQQQQQAVSSSSLQVPTLHKNGSTNPCQEFQLFRAPDVSGFYSYEGLG